MRILNRLEYEQSSFKSQFRNHIKTMNEEVVEALDMFLEHIIDNHPEFKVKVTSLPTQVAIHIGRYESGNEVAAWIEVRKKWFNLCLRNKTRVNNLWDNVSHRVPPHGTVLMRITSTKKINDFMSLILQSDRVNR